MDPGRPQQPAFFRSHVDQVAHFSNDESETWYFIQFRNGGYTLQDMGQGQCIRLATADPIDEQLWKLVGDASNFQLVNKAGRYAVVSSTSASSESPANNTPLRAYPTPQKKGFKLVESPNATYMPAWEIQPNGQTANALNQWGGAQQGRSIGLWTVGDPNNPLAFVSPNEMSYPDYKVVGIEGFTPENKLTLWYDKPATLTGVGNIWMEYSLPIGTDSSAQASSEVSTRTRFSSTKDAVERTQHRQRRQLRLLPELRLCNCRGHQWNFQLQLGWRSARLLPPARPHQRHKQGDLQKSRQIGDIFSRVFVSNPAGAIVARYAADKDGQVSLRFTLNAGKPGVKATTKYAEGEAAFAGKLETVSYNARLKVVPTGGEMTTTDEGIVVKNANEVLVVLAGATDFDPSVKSFVSNTSQLGATVQARVDNAAANGFEALKEEHVADYQNFFSRVDFDLDGTANTMPTNKLVDTYNQGKGTNARMLETLYFAYGRYLEISSSRGVDLPSNLQGIWNNVSQAPWHADIHSNINVQMNYWPAEPTNLSETHLPFLNYIINMAAGNHKEWAGYAKAAGQSADGLATRRTTSSVA